MLNTSDRSVASKARERGLHLPWIDVGYKENDPFIPRIDLMHLKLRAEDTMYLRMVVEILPIFCPRYMDTVDSDASDQCGEKWLGSEVEGELASR